jgi:hypothetical protein
MGEVFLAEETGKIFSRHFFCGVIHVLSQMETLAG